MINLKVLPKFPSDVRGAQFITVTKTSGIWTITADISLLNVPVVDNLSNYETLVRNITTGIYGRVPLTNLLASSYLASLVTTSIYNVSATETYLRCTLSAAAVINLPPSANRNGLALGIKDVTGNFATFNATLNANGSEKIDGLPSLTANQNYQYIELRPNNAGWEITHFG